MNDMPEGRVAEPSALASRVAEASLAETLPRDARWRRRYARLRVVECILVAQCLSAPVLFVAIGSPPLWTALIGALGAASIRFLTFKNDEGAALQIAGAILCREIDWHLKLAELTRQAMPGQQRRPGRPLGVPTGPQDAAILRRLLADGYTMEAAAKRVGMSVRTARRRLRDYPDLSSAPARDS